MINKSSINCDGNIFNDDWEYAKQGIALWLNNEPDQAEEHFRAKMEKTNVYAGYTFITVMNGVISYETDKIELAQSMLKELERRCSTDNGWIRSFRTRWFGGGGGTTEGEDGIDSKPMVDILEQKIILADSLMCSAILTFLTQDFGGLMRGSWLLRKAWKIYQTTYSQIYELYKATCRNSGENSTDSGPSRHHIEPVTPMETETQNGSTTTMVRSQTTYTINSPNKTKIFPFSKKASINLLQHPGNVLSCRTSGTIASARQKLVQLPKNVSTKLKQFERGKDQDRDVHSHHDNQATSSSTSTRLIPDANSVVEKSHPSKSSLFLDLKSTTTSEWSSPGSQSSTVTETTNIRNGFSIRQVPFSCPEPVPSPFTRVPPIGFSDFDPEIIKRLMGAISFGYGIFQLSVSLLPPNLLRLISFFGFEGNKNVGISSLVYSKSSSDMRSPLATLALLWYYTIGAQLFHLDDSNTENEILASKQLLKESQQQYATSAIFLFFRGRLKRLQCDMNTAIDFYDAAYRMSAQRELKLLCLHEVGWCRLIQLDFGNAMLHFHELKLASNFSKGFYTYLTTICQGAFGRFDNLIKLKNELAEMINRPNHKETQIDKFIKRRIDKLPSSEADRNMFQSDYWKFFIYEMLFLWNTIHSCGPDVVFVIISDCSQPEENLNEPSVGLASLILGTCEANRHHFNEAIQAFRKCIERRQGMSEDNHLSAFAYYELAMLLLKEQTEHGQQEAKTMLQYAQQFFKNYDFESRLTARIHAALRNLI